MTSHRRGLIVLLLLLAACGTEGGSATDPGGGSPPPGEYVAAGLPAPPFRAGDRVQVTLTDRDLGYRAACNGFSGPARWRDGVLALDTVAGTEMGCPGAGHEQDEWLTDFFTGRPAYTLEGGRVRLTAGDTELLLVPAADAAPDPAVDPAVDLVGTRWRLTGVERTDGDAVSMTGTGRVRSELRVEDGRLSVDTGCNAGGAAVVVEADLLRVGELESTAQGCRGLRGEIDDAVRSVLGAPEVAWSVAGRQLRLTTGGTTLLYEAR